MDCESYEALVVDLLYGELEEERRAEAQSHAASCAECGKLSKELDDARKTAATLPARIAPPRALDERVLLAARAAADVRAHPWRGSMFHVAAAAVLACLLVGVSFSVGAKYGQPKPPMPDIDVPIPNKHYGSVDILDKGPPRTITPNLDPDSTRAYMVNLVKLAGEELATGHVQRALDLYGPAYASGGRSHMALEARLGMAKCLRALGRLEDARAAARDAREKNMDWGTNWDDIDDEASKLIKEINHDLELKQR